MSSDLLITDWVEYRKDEISKVCWFWRRVGSFANIRMVPGFRGEDAPTPKFEMGDLPPDLVLDLTRLPPHYWPKYTAFYSNHTSLCYEVQVPITGWNPELKTSVPAPEVNKVVAFSEGAGIDTHGAYNADGPARYTVPVAGLYVWSNKGIPGITHRALLKAGEVLWDLDFLFRVPR